MLPSSNPSKTQIDHLGDRLRQGDVSEEDLRLLDNYRRSFSDAYEEVVGRIQDQLGLEPTGRPQKTRTSIIEKLRRQNTRLSQMQDIAGCRIVVVDLLTQDEAVERLKGIFGELHIDDRRKQPSYGYRAVHVVVQETGKLIEVQVRTWLQHLWAEVSEKLSDIDPSIKYGRGDPDMLIALDVMSQNISAQEIAEAAHLTIMSSDDEEDEDELFRQGPQLAEILKRRIAIINMLDAIRVVFPRMKGPKE